MPELSEQAYKLRYRKAKNTVLNYSIGASGVAMLPIPLLDLVVLSALQVKMLNSLAQQYNIEFSKNIGKSLIASLVGGLLPVSASTTLISLTKSVPGIGTATGIASMTIFAGASTYAIGQVFIQHFEAGGTFLDLDPEAVRDFFAREFKAGESMISQVRQEKVDTVDMVDTPAERAEAEQTADTATTKSPARASKNTTRARKTPASRRKTASTDIDSDQTGA